MARVAIVFCLLLAVVAAAPRKKNPVAISGKIIGGSEIDISEVPHLVSLQFRGKPFCGASIIGSQYLLTAAHCVELGTKADYSVRAGSNTHTKGGQTRKVDKIIIHPKYSNSTAKNDIAVLKLKEPFSKNLTVSPIELAETEPNKGEEVVVSGWGGTREGEYSTRTLLSVTVTVVSRKECQNAYKNLNTITGNMFCAGASRGGKDACQGDSGGAAVIDGKLAGIVSWGLGCGRKGTPGVYTNVAKYRKWIQEQTRSGHKD